MAKNAKVTIRHCSTKTDPRELKIVPREGRNVNGLTDRLLGLVTRLQTPKNVNIKTINVSKYCFFSEGGN